MGAAKWIGGLLGWVIFGPIGGLLGFVIGSIADSGAQAPVHASGTKGYTPGEQRNSFLVSLLVLSSAVIKADGRVHPAEMERVRSFIRSNFGEGAVAQAMSMLEEFNRQQVNIYSVGPQIAANMNYSQRVQLLHYLAGIAAADADFSEQERRVLEAIAGSIGISRADMESVLAMFRKDIDSAYKVLEVSPSATDAEIKSAYRRMAMKNHPDKVATLGPDVQKAAEEKFRQVQEAYETIKRERGIA